jgi:hypothetical protein
LVLLGDTYDPSPITPLCLNPSPFLLVHRATDSHITRKAYPSGNLFRRSADEVLKKALSRGHSVPAMAGAFAKKVDAQKLALNHIGGRYAPLYLPTHKFIYCRLGSQHNVSQVILHAFRLYMTSRRKQVKLGAQKCNNCLGFHAGSCAF